MLTIAKDTSRALLSGWADFFWMVIGALFFSNLSTIIAIQMMGALEVTNGDQQVFILKISISATSIFFLIFLIFWPRSSFLSQGVPRSWKAAFSVAFILLIVKFCLNRVFDQSNHLSLARTDLQLVMLVVILVPMVEEAFFRGLAWNTFLSRLISEIGTLIATTILFVIAHAPSDLNSFTQLCGMSISLGLIRYFSGSIWLGVAAHGMMNAIVLFNI